MYIGRASFRDPPLVFLKFLCCVVIELFNFKNLMRLMQMHLKPVGYTDTVLFPTIGNAVNVQTPDIGKPDIYCKKVR